MSTVSRRTTLAFLFILALTVGATGPIAAETLPEPTIVDLQDTHPASVPGETVAFWVTIASTLSGIAQSGVGEVAFSVSGPAPSAGVICSETQPWVWESNPQLVFGCQFTMAGIYSVTATYTDGPRYAGSTTTILHEVVGDGCTGPQLVVGDVAQHEGSTGGTTSFVFTVSIVGDVCAPVSFSYATADVTTGPGDYVATSGAVIGATTFPRQITVPVAADTLVEPDETFTLTISGVTAAVAPARPATGTILDDDLVIVPPPPPAATGLFKAYRVEQRTGAGSDVSRFVKRVATLVDQFGTDEVLIYRPRLLLNPASTNAAAPSTAAPHLVCYDIKDGRGDDFPRSAKRPVEVTNTYGTQVLTVKTPELLCVPAAKALAGAEPGPVPPAAASDQFKCYKVEDKPKTPRSSITLTDQFGTEADQTRDAELLCNPVSTDGSPVLSPASHLVCYGLHPREHKIMVRTRDQYGVLDLRVQKSELLCVSSTKRVL